MTDRLQTRSAGAGAGPGPIHTVVKDHLKFSLKTHSVHNDNKVAVK